MDALLQILEIEDDELLLLLTPDRITRFWSKVLKSDGCWLWLPAIKAKQQYGRVKIAGKLFQATHVAYTITFGPVPKGQWALHHCDNPPCVRPDHLFAGTRTDNMKDAANKGRLPTQKITREQADALREERRVRGTTMRELGIYFGVRRDHVKTILHGECW
jgi:hypothetical protein